MFDKLQVSFCCSLVVVQHSCFSSKASDLISVSLVDDSLFVSQFDGLILHSGLWNCDELATSPYCDGCDVTLTFAFSKWLDGCYKYTPIICNAVFCFCFFFLFVVVSI